MDNLQETYELVSNKEMVTALEVNVDGVMITLEEFANDYNSINNNITELCIKAHHLAKFNRQIFMEYVTKTMGLSRSSAVQMINAGDIYVETGSELLPVSYTKVAELTPVKEQIWDYGAYIKGFETVASKTQKEIRESVKNFLALADSQLTDLDETGENEETESEVVDDSEITETVEESKTDVTPQVNNIIDIVTVIKSYISEFTTNDSEGLVIDKDDVKVFKSIVGNLDLILDDVHTIIKVGGLSYDDTNAIDESEV